MKNAIAVFAVAHIRCESVPKRREVRSILVPAGLERLLGLAAVSAGMRTPFYENEGVTVGKRNGGSRSPSAVVLFVVMYTS